MPDSYENQMVITGDNYAISQLHVDDIENILLVTIDKVDRTQPFKLTIYFNTYGTSSASLDYITHILKKIRPSRYSRRIVLPQRRCSLCRLCEQRRC
jgi:hypothetical protein